VKPVVQDESLADRQNSSMWCPDRAEKYRGQRKNGAAANFGGEALRQTAGVMEMEATPETSAHFTAGCFAAFRGHSVDSVRPGSRFKRRPHRCHFPEAADGHQQLFRNSGVEVDSAYANLGEHLLGRPAQIFHRRMKQMGSRPLIVRNATNHGR